MGVDSGAEVTVWPPEMFLEVATVESNESRRGGKFVGPGSVDTGSQLLTFSEQQLLTLCQCGNHC